LKKRDKKKKKKNIDEVFVLEYLDYRQYTKKDERTFQKREVMSSPKKRRAPPIPYAQKSTNAVTCWRKRGRMTTVKKSTRSRLRQRGNQCPAADQKGGIKGSVEVRNSSSACRGRERKVMCRQQPDFIGEGSMSLSRRAGWD